MPPTNAEIAMQMLEAVNRQDKDLWLSVCDPEVEWNPPADWPESGAIKGAEAVFEFVGTLNDPWAEGEYELTDLVDAGSGRLVVRLQRTMQGRTSGAVVDFEYWNVVSFRDGRISRVQWFAERHEAVEAAGESAD